ncbi:MAG TPA: hypothetical protein DD377_03970 [Firmicutes bacterium]|nr:hypothetical protein [Bacillota bacterium]
MERFIGILIENYGGAFPTWLSPVQVKVLPVNPAIQAEYANKVVDTLKKNGVRVELDSSNEKLGYRLRNAQVEKVPFTLVLGDKEAETNSVTYRVYGEKDQINVSLEKFVELILDSIKNKKRYL